MCGAGLVRASLAIESGNEYLRNKIMHKNLKTEKIYKVVEFAKTFKDLHIAAFFLIGMPEETVESLQDTYDMIQRLGINRYYINNVIPFPGTDLFTQCIEDNLFTKKIDLDNIWKTVYGWQEYKHNKSVEQFHIKPYNMALDDLLYFREKMNEFIGKTLNSKTE
jgi:magnesium-protoporphyrin IX monomethyl ester (oxidative) cyclase